MAPDITDILAAARRRESTIRMCLRGDLLAEHDALERDLGEQLDRLGLTAPPADGAGALGDLADRLLELERDIAEQTTTFRFQALRRTDWEALVAAHPPREDHHEGWNEATFGPALVQACLVDPYLTATQFIGLLDIVNEGQFDALFEAALAANQEATVSVPFSKRASAVSRWREQNSKPPAPGASPGPSS